MSTALAIALAILGIMVLVVLHELGHFFAARAVGMRVEKLYLFFGKPIWKVQRGETEYGVGSIPLGGYAKITGMNPEEELPPDVAPRAYYAMPVWKRCFVILAGPAVNLVVAFVILFATSFGIEEAKGIAVGRDRRRQPRRWRAPARRPHRLGRRGLAKAETRSSRRPPSPSRSPRTSAEASPRRTARPRRRPRSSSMRDGERMVLELTPYYDEEVDRTRLGFAFQGADFQPLNPDVIEATDIALDQMWLVTSETGKTFAQLFKAEEREKLGSIVGAVETTRQAIQFDAETALRVIALVSLSLALINLLPILPLDGGHVFWSLVEKVRGKRVSLRTMEQASVVGFMLILIIFAIGFTNDLDRFSNGGFDLR